jgi:hypothetical protein
MGLSIQQIHNRIKEKIRASEPGFVSSNAVVKMVNFSQNLQWAMNHRKYLLRDRHQTAFAALVRQSMVKSC